MKKKILFCCYGLGIGGIEKCMINLLNAIDTTRYEIDVLPMNPEYALAGSLHADVNMLDPFDYVMNTTDTVKVYKKRKERILSYVKYGLFRLINKWGRKPWKLFKAPSKRYDIAIAYAHTGYVPYYVVDKIKATRKYMWHHEGRYVRDNHYKLDKEYYPKLDGIIAVSKDDRKILLDVFPNLKGKINVLYNIVDKEEIRIKADANIDIKPDYNKIILTTVGRLSQQKGPDLLLDVAENLKKEQVQFQWYWVGDGNLSDYMRIEITKRKLTDQVILLGNQKNPYPYIKFCDIYVQPSYYEAYCTTTLEAQVLEKPIVVTDVPGMREQFVPEKDCIMVNVDANDIFKAVQHLIDQPEQRERLHQELHRKMELDDGILQKYYKLFDR